MAFRQNPKFAASLRLFTGGLLDLVYPPRCLVCEKYDSPALCESCAQAFTPVPAPVCGTCGRPVESEQSVHCRTCEAHRESSAKGWSFEAAQSAGILEGSLRLALHRLKYNGMEGLGLPLGAYLANRIGSHELFSRDQLKSIDGVLAVPMHPLRERSRGFNQAVLLAAPVAEMLGVPLLPSGLVRRRRRPAQVGLSPEARRRNLQDTFFIPPTGVSVLAGRHILLIDDVFTTGATAHSCSDALRSAEVAQVLVATLASGG